MKNIALLFAALAAAGLVVGGAAPFFDEVIQNFNEARFGMNR